MGIKPVSNLAASEGGKKENPAMYVQEIPVRKIRV